jgi:hypothetical protein
MTSVGTAQALVERFADTLGRLETCWKKRMAYSIVEHPTGGEGADWARCSQDKLCGRSRREFLATLAVLGIGAVVPAEAYRSGQSAQLPPASDMKTIGLIGGTS